MRPGWLLAAAVLVSTSVAATSLLTLREVNNSIATVGPRITLDRLYQDKGKWAALLAGIATGEHDWLSAAKRLRRASDGGASEQIDLAAGEALAHHPANVLSLVVDEFGLDTVCGGPDVDDPRFDSYDLSLAAIRGREEMLRAVHNAGLIQKRNACLEELERAKLDIARFYGRPAP